MRRTFKLLPLVLVASLTACDIATRYHSDTLYCFDTTVIVESKEYHGLMYNVVVQEQTCQIIKDVDAISDAYKKREVTNIFDLNQTNDKLEINEDLYWLLHECKELERIAPNFNPLIGSLSNKWKKALEENTALSNDVIEEELTKINNSELVLSMTGDNTYFAQRKGDALIDVGAIAKGFALDQCQVFLRKHSEPDYEYMINAGNSSVLLGMNRKKNNYKVKLKDLSKDTYLYLKDSYVSTSGISEQKTTIDGVAYSHIINPKTGSAVSLYDTVIVVANGDYGNGALGDVLATSFMMSDLEEIKQSEKENGVNVIVIKDDKILYKSENIELS